MSFVSDKADIQPLVHFLKRIAAIDPRIASGRFEDGNWWVKFSILIDHQIAWQVVQELGHILNYVSLDERLPTVFKPVSPPPYMNGGPKDFLAWVIECTDPAFAPATCVEWLEGRLPRPVDDPTAWHANDG